MVIKGYLMAALALALLMASPARAQQQEANRMKKLTPVLIVDEIEPCLKFWVERLGFEKSAEVPEGDKLGFVILAREGVEVMYQTRASVAKDVPALGNLRGPAMVYIEVADIDAVARRLAGLPAADVVVPMRTTFYGAREVIVREPAGNVVAFAMFAAREEK